MLIKNSFIYLFSSLFGKATPFLLLPILTYFLTPSEYGTLSIFSMLSSFFLACYGGLHANVSRAYFGFDKVRFDKYLAALFAVLFFALVVVLFLTWIYLNLGFSTFNLDPKLFLLIPLTSAFSMVILINLTLLRTEEKAISFAKWEISQSMFNLLLSLILLIFLAGGLYGRIFGILVPIVLFGITSLWLLQKRHNILTKPLKKDIKDTLHVSLPLIPHAIGAILISSVDLVIIEHLLCAELVGIYSVGYQVSMVLLILSDSFLKAWQPWFFKKLNDNSSATNMLILRNIYLFVGTLIILACSFAFIGQLVLPWFIDAKFAQAVDVIFPVCLGYIFFGIYQILFPYLIHVKKTKMLALITPASALINIALNFYLIPIYGIVGAAYATVVSYMVISLLVFHQVNKHYSTSWSFFNAFPALRLFK